MKFKIGLLVCLVGMLTTPTVFAQLALPSLDPTMASESPAVGGWRRQSSAYGSFGEGSGDRLSGTTLAYNLVTSTTNGGILLPYESVSFELATNTFEQRTTQTISNAYKGLQKKVQRNDFNMSLGDRTFVTLGLGSISGVREFQYESGLQTTDVSGVNAGMTMRFVDWLFVGGNFKKMLDRTTGLTDNRYSEAGVGVGARFGQPGGTQFQLEFASLTSQEHMAGLDLTAQYHPKTLNEYMAVELMMRGLLFTSHMWVANTDYVQAHPILSTTYKQTTRRTENGVLWVPASGISLGFYFNEISESDGVIRTNLSDFTIKGAYLF